MDALINDFSKLRDDVRMSAADAYVGDREDQFSAYENLRRRIDQELPRLNEIADTMRSIENGDAQKKVAVNDKPPIPKEGFKRAFLDSLREMGGQARVSHIMDRIENKMGTSFTEADHRCDTPSDPKRPRWKSNVYGLIQLLVSEGLISKVSTGIYKLGK
jgi:hypothetical protein